MTFYRLYKMYRYQGHSIRRAFARAWEVSSYG